jgi:hypothetical protein
VSDYLGYRFRPSRYFPALGHAGLDVELSDKPRNSLYYIRSATFRVASSRLAFRTFHDLAGTNGGPQLYKVGIGCLRLLACNNDQVCGFSFGGFLEIEDHGDVTICSLNSAAPVFEMTEGENTACAFVLSELQVQMARWRARWLKDDIGFENRLLAANPYHLFIAGLATLNTFLPPLVRWGEEYRLGLRWVRRAIDTLGAAGEWLEPPPTFDDLI